MNIIAFVLSFFTAAMSFLQGGCVGVLSDVGHEFATQYGSHSAQMKFAATGGFSALVIISSFIGLAGGALALVNKKGSSITLFVAAGMCGLASLVLGTGFNDPAIYGIIYAIAGLCAMIGSSDTRTENYSNTSKSGSYQYQGSTLHHTSVNLNKSNVPAPEPTTKKTSYEPIVGVETASLIKRSLLFMEDGDTYNAERYIEQALNQSPEDPQVYMTKLMIEHKVFTPEALVESLSTPLEDEKLFQRALRFADDDYKTQLDRYLQLSHDKFEQERLAKEAAKAAEQEKHYQEILKLKDTASTITEFDNLLKLINSISPYKDTDELYIEVSHTRQEKLYQEILNLKSTASTIQDFNNLLKLINSIKPYKDTEELYNEVSQILAKEVKYQHALYWKERCTKYFSDKEDFRRLIRQFEELNGYKDSEKLLAEVKEALQKEEQRKRRNKSILIAVIGICILSAVFYYMYQKKVDANNAFTAAQSFEARKLYDDALSQYLKADELGHPEAQRYLNALESKLAQKRAQEELRQSQATGAFNLAKSYEAVGNYDEALSKYREAVRLGHPDAKERITALEDKIAQRRRQEREQQERKAQEEDQRRRVRANNAFNTAQYYDRKGDTINALKFYNEAIELSHPDAQRYLNALESKLAQKTQDSVFNVTPEIQADYSQAETFLNDKNYSQALNIFRKLANLGYAPAQDKLAWMYQNGWGVQQSHSTAVDWFRKAANQGNTEAMASMGLMYYRGWGVVRNYDTSLEWYSKAAAQGSEVAQRRINSINLLKVNKQIISSIERRNDFPVPGTIFATSLSVRQSPNTKSTVAQTLKTGHPISISKARESDDDYWFYITTASGTEGWVLAGYVNLNDERDLSYNEINNRRYSLPRQGYVSTAISSDHLNLRNIPAIQGSKVLEKIDNRASITAYEIFAGDTIDWYRVRTISGNVGWVSGKYIVLY